MSEVDFRFFDKVLLKDLLVEDRKKDTLLYAGEASANITDWFFVKDKVTLYKIGLRDAVVNMQRTDSIWNYQFLTDYFSSPRDPSKPKKKGHRHQYRKHQPQQHPFQQNGQVDWARYDGVFETDGGKY